MRARIVITAVALVALAACEDQNKTNANNSTTTTTPPANAHGMAANSQNARGAMGNASEPVGQTTITAAAPAVKSGKLNGKTIAILAADGVEQAELTEPRAALAEQGAKTLVVSPKGGTVQSYMNGNKGELVSVDETVSAADAKRFDGLFIPGGALGTDALKLDPQAVAFVKAFVQEDKPVAAISQGPWLLIDANDVKGKTLTSWPSLKTDVRNAGGTWVDQPVVTQPNLVTSQNPNDISAFDVKMIDEFASSKK